MPNMYLQQESRSLSLWELLTRKTTELNSLPRGNMLDQTGVERWISLRLAKASHLLALKIMPKLCTKRVLRWVCRRLPRRMTRCVSDFLPPACAHVSGVAACILSDTTGPAVQSAQDVIGTIIIDSDRNAVKNMNQPKPEDPDLEEIQGSITTNLVVNIKPS